MFDIFLIVIFISYITWSEYQHSKERKQLYSRIQARDLTEYKRVEESKPKEEKEKVMRFV